jgi:rhodanese-related sulfurtransferase
MDCDVIALYGQQASWLLLINYSVEGKKKMCMGKSVLKIFLIMGLVAGMATPTWAFLNDKFEKEVEKEAGAVKLVREVRRGGYDVVTTEELKKWIDSGKDMLIVDTMPYENSYKKQHVPGAVQFLFPIPDMKEWDTKETGGKSLEDLKKLLGGDKEKPIVIYCGFVKCTRSHNGAAWAVKLGYKNVYRYPGGIFAWKGADFPVEKVK